MFKILTVPLFLTFFLLLGSSIAGAADDARVAPAISTISTIVSHEPPAWFKQSFLDLRDDVKEASSAGRRVMLYFYQDGCPYCSKMLQNNFGQKAIADKTRQHFDVIALNIWGDREVVDLSGKAMPEKAFATAQKVQFTPSLLLLDEKGEVALRLNGYIPPHKFSAALDFVGQRLEKKQNFSDYLAAKVREPASGQLHGEAWLMKPPLKLAAAQKTGKPLLVLFEQKECAACDELHEEAFTRSDVAALLKQFQVAQIDMAARESVQTPAGETLAARDWARRIGVFYTPSLLFFDAKGREVFRVEGYLKSFHLASSLEYVASGAYRTQPEFQRFIETRAAQRRAKGERVELMQ